MTTETTCLSSIWAADQDTRAFLTMHGRGDDYRDLKPGDVAYYDGCFEVDLSNIKPMIALPFHPSNGFEIDELNENLEDCLLYTSSAPVRPRCLTSGAPISLKRNFLPVWVPAGTFRRTVAPPGVGTSTVQRCV